MTRRFEESLYAGYFQCFDVGEILFEKKTGLHQLIVFQSASHGRVLALDGIVQVTEADAFIYHEMLVHVPIIAHGKVGKVLIVGGGDGGSLREVLRHEHIAATMVEIDRTVIDVCQTHMPEISDGAFDDPRAEVIIADGVAFVAETDCLFDVIIVDGTDPVGPGEALFSESFYAHCKDRLTSGGVLVTQNGVPFFQSAELSTTYARLTPLFDDVSFFTTPVPSYVGGLMTLAWASDDQSLRRLPAEVLRRRHAEAGLSTRYYTPEIHWGSLQLPPYISELLTAETDPE